MRPYITLTLGCLLYWLSTSCISQTDSVEGFALAHGYQKVPLRKASTGHDLVTATINGVEGSFVLDTGAVTIINLPLEPKYRLSKDTMVKTMEAAGAAGHINISIHRIDALTIDGVQSLITQLGSSDLNAVLNGLYNSTGHRLDGIIGQDLLMKSQAIIDVGKQHLYLHNTGQTGSTGLYQLMGNLGFTKFTLQPIKLNDFDLTLMTVTAKINGTQLSLILDSGAGTSMLSNTSLEKLKLSDAQPLANFNTTGAGGAVNINTYLIKRFELNNIKLNKSSIASTNLSAVVDFIEKHTGKKVGGILGQDVLTQSKAVIDLANSQLYLKI